MAIDKYWAKHIEQLKAHIEEKSTKSTSLTADDIYAYAEKQALLVKVRIVEQSLNDDSVPEARGRVIGEFIKAIEAMERYRSKKHD